MTHPEDLLAAYVDGTLSEQERGAVDAHLSSCETCREEVALATRAVGMLASLPEEPVPFGVTGPVLAEARRLAELRRPVWAKLQWAVGLAAAACVVLLAVVLVPRLTGGSDEEGAELRGPAAESATSDSGAGAALAAQPPTLERLKADLDERDVARLAERSAKMSLPAPQPAAGMTSKASDAIDCLTTSGATIDDKDVLVRLIDATYLDAPAYLGVFHEGPGGDEPPDTVVVWVVAKADCSILTLLSRNI
jgi:anti-sigma factor RsiW